MGGGDEERHQLGVTAAQRRHNLLLQIKGTREPRDPFIRSHLAHNDDDARRQRRRAVSVRDDHTSEEGATRRRRQRRHQRVERGQVAEGDGGQRGGGRRRRVGRRRRRGPAGGADDFEAVREGETVGGDDPTARAQRCLLYTSPSPRD